VCHGGKAGSGEADTPGQAVNSANARLPLEPVECGGEMHDARNAAAVFSYRVVAARHAFRRALRFATSRRLA
jgi:hypothetical protein